MFTRFFTSAFGVNKTQGSDSNSSVMSKYYLNPVPIFKPDTVAEEKHKTQLSDDYERDPLSDLPLYTGCQLPQAKKDLMNKYYLKPVPVPQEQEAGAALDEIKPGTIMQTKTKPFNNLLLKLLTKRLDSLDKRIKKLENKSRGKTK